MSTSYQWSRVSWRARAWHTSLHQRASATIRTTQAMVSFSQRIVLALSTEESQKATVLMCISGGGSSPIRSTSRQLTYSGDRSSKLVRWDEGIRCAGLRGEICDTRQGNRWKGSSAAFSCGVLVNCFTRLPGFVNG